MKLIQPPNSKLNNTYLFNLPATQQVCNRICPGCYAAKEQVRFPSVLAARESRLTASAAPDFATRIISELGSLHKPPAFFRIHASGEFYSQPYVDSWSTIAAQFPDIVFYAYTKRLTDFDFTAFKSLPNTVLINSLHFGKLNYGPLSAAPANAFVCPSSASVHCGLQCTYCMTKTAEQNGVYFVKH
ncbi:MAG: GP88 family protein [Sulfuricurvum sp.]